MIQTIDLPHPFSVNKMYRNASAREKARGVKKRPHSEEYNTWARAAGWMVKAAKVKQLRGDCELHLIVCRKYRGDLDNVLKPVLDLFQQCGVVLNDKQFVRLSVERGDVETMRAVIAPATEAKAKVAA